MICQRCHKREGVISIEIEQSGIRLCAKCSDTLMNWFRRFITQLHKPTTT